MVEKQEMVEVFKTNVTEASKANELIALLTRRFPGSKITFDLEDCDKILRVATYNTAICTVSLIELVVRSGFRAEILPD